MSARTIELTDRLYAYLLESAMREQPLQRRLREVTTGVAGAGMQISPEQGQLMAFLVRLIGAKRGIEVGTFTGYSALAVALVLPNGGELICCDVNAETTAVARRFWAEAGVADKIDLRLAPALDTLDFAAGQWRGGRLRLRLHRRRQGQLRCLLRAGVAPAAGGRPCHDRQCAVGGAVADPRDRDASTQAIRKLNAKIREDQRVDMVLVPIGDGLTLVRKR